MKKIMDIRNVLLLRHMKLQFKTSSRQLLNVVFCIVISIVIVGIKILKYTMLNKLTIFYY